MKLCDACKEEGRANDPVESCRFGLEQCRPDHCDDGIRYWAYPDLHRSCAKSLIVKMSATLLIERIGIKFLHKSGEI